MGMRTTTRHSNRQSPAADGGDVDNASLYDCLSAHAGFLVAHAEFPVAHAEFLAAHAEFLAAHAEFLAGHAEFLAAYAVSASAGRCDRPDPVAGP